jgi:hypothetical protein
LLWHGRPGAPWRYYSCRKNPFTCCQINPIYNRHQYHAISLYFWKQNISNKSHLLPSGKKLMPTYFVRIFGNKIFQYINDA